MTHRRGAIQERQRPLPARKTPNRLKASTRRPPRPEREKTEPDWMPVRHGIQDPKTEGDRRTMRDQKTKGVRRTMRD